MNTSYSITSKFQITIPKEIREELGITADDRIRFKRKGNTVVLLKEPTLEELADETAEKFKNSNRVPATESEIQMARSTFYKQGGKW